MTASPSAPPSPFTEAVEVRRPIARVRVIYFTSRYGHEFSHWQVEYLPPGRSRWWWNWRHARSCVTEIEARDYADQVLREGAVIDWQYARDEAPSMTAGFYSSMSDLELVGHVSAIPDASELSQALAGRVKLLVEEREQLQLVIRKTERQIMSLELGVALDKVAGYEEIISEGRHGN